MQDPRYPFISLLPLIALKELVGENGMTWKKGVRSEKNIVTIGSSYGLVERLDRSAFLLSCCSCVV